MYLIIGFLVLVAAAFLVFMVMSYRMARQYANGMAQEESSEEESEDARSLDDEAGKGPADSE